MKLYLPVALNEIGGRQNNEDNIYPSFQSATASDRLFIVCDGVGGQNKGEVASELICKELNAYFESSFLSSFPENKENVEVDSFLERALKYVEGKMSDYLIKYPNCRGMASTLTLIYFFDDAVWLGWVGDSRIYHIRNGEVLYRTKDHSIVEDLIRVGEITPEEAKTHPQRNVITRAVKGKDEPTKIDKHLIHEVEANDYFFLCTDGILENFSETEIGKWFLREKAPEAIKNNILQNAQGRTRDNFSMYLLKVQEAGQVLKPKTKTEVESKIEKKVSRRNTLIGFGLGVVSTLFILFLVLLLVKPEIKIQEFFSNQLKPLTGTPTNISAGTSTTLLGGTSTNISASSSTIPLAGTSTNISAGTPTENN